MRGIGFLHPSPNFDRRFSFASPGSSYPSPARGEDKNYGNAVLFQTAAKALNAFAGILQCFSGCCVGNPEVRAKTKG